MNIQTKFRSCLAASLASVILAGCTDSSSSLTPIPTTPPAASQSPPAMIDFRIEVTNLTLAQPLSPVALVAHSDNYSAFSLGSMATDGLEQLSEGGDNTAFLAEADADPEVISTSSSDGPIGPGGTTAITVSVDEDEVTGMMLTAISMLVNTNDAITASMNISVDNLLAGESISRTTRSYDTGTEANSEAAGTIPGPADGGEGFNVSRDDIADAIRGHSGVVTAADGLATSVLTDMHRWDNPVARVQLPAFSVKEEVLLDTLIAIDLNFIRSMV